MKCKFQAGDKVVCVDAADSTFVGRLRPMSANERLTEGAIYTVAEVEPYDCPVKGEHIILILKEKPRVGQPRGYHTQRFRPAEDIEQFRRLCTNLPVDAELVE